MKRVSFYDERGYIIGGVAMDHSQYEIVGSKLDPHVDGAWEGDAHFVVSGEVRSRPKNPATLEGMALVNVPVPATIVIRDPVRDGNHPEAGKAYPCNSATVELSFEHEGTYAVRVESWPYLDKEFTVENPPR